MELSRADHSILTGRAHYDRQSRAVDYSATVDNMDSVDSGQLLMGTLQVELDRRSGRLLYAWGYHPAESWHRADLPVVPVITSAVVVSGIPALQIDEGFEVWPWEQPLVSIWDDGRRLLRVGPQPVQPESVLIEFAEGEFLETESTGHAIYALWIQLAVE